MSGAFIRVVLSLLLTAITIVLLLPGAEARRDAELRLIQPCPVVNPKSKDVLTRLHDSVFGDECENRVKKQQQKAEGNITSVVAFAPVWLLAYIILLKLSTVALERIRGMVQESAARARQERTIQEHQTAARRRAEAIEDADRLERLKIARTNLINKLGTASNYVLHLADPVHQPRRMFIEQQIAQELRGIVAKYSVQELRDLTATYPELRMKLDNLHAALLTHMINNEDITLMREIAGVKRTLR